MIIFHIKELLTKNKMSRYKLEKYSKLSYERINDYYFGRVKSIKVEELEELCNLFNCNTQDIVERNTYNLSFTSISFKFTLFMFESEGIKIYFLKRFFRW